MREPPCRVISSTPCRVTALTQNITPKYEHLFDGTLGEFNMEIVPISL
jgi:hypothetical protein